MADIVFRYTEMRQTATNIRNIATQYKSAGDAFERDFVNAVSDWEGESHDALVKFISGPTLEYMSVTIPKLLEALAQLLEDNAAQMEKADQEIAANIPQSLG